MVKSTITFTVFVLFLVSPIIVADWERNIYVHSTRGIDNESCWSDKTPCATINFALKGIKHDSTVIFVHPGSYRLYNGTETQLRGKSQVGIIGLSNPVNISCRSFTGLSFTMSENIILENLIFHGCGRLQNTEINKQSYTFQVAVFMLFCKNIQINNVVIESSYGTGLTMYNTVGNVSVWGSKLINNGLKGHGSCGGGLSIILRSHASAGNDIFIIDSNVIEGNYADSGGGLYILAESEINVFIRNTKMSKNTAFTGLAVSLINNGSHNSNNYYEISDSKFIENSPPCFNYEQSSSGTVFANSITLNFSGNILFKKNNASGLKVKQQTKILVSEESFINFEENNGVVGGGIALFDCSYVVVYSKTQLQFTNNYVSKSGGAIYSGPCTFNGKNIIPTSQCFIQYYRPHIHPDEWENVKFNFISNKVCSADNDFNDYDYNYDYYYSRHDNAISAASLSLCWWPSLNSSLLTPNDIDNTLHWNNWYYSPDKSVIEVSDLKMYKFVYNDSCLIDYCGNITGYTDNDYTNNDYADNDLTDKDYTGYDYNDCTDYDYTDYEYGFCPRYSYDPCENGQAVPINSFQLSCFDCNSTSLVNGWLVFIFVQMVPVTFLVLLIMTLNINLTQGSASGYILYCQLLSTSFPGLKTGYPAWLQFPCYETAPIYFFLPLSIWNLNFLTALPASTFEIPIFITCSMDQLGAISFWYLIAAYPMILLMLFYIWLMMYDKGFMCVVYITGPIHRILARFWHMFNIEPSIIRSLASVYVLCVMQFLVTSLKLLNAFYSNSDGNVNVTFYYDHSLYYFGWPHSLAGLYAITILMFIVIFPMLYILLYPFKWFHTLFNKFKLHKQLLVALADVFTGPYKDGTENTKNYRWFAGLYLLLRVVFISMYLLHVNHSTSVAIVSVQLLLTLLISAGLTIFGPYKRTIHNFSETSLWLILSTTNTVWLIDRTAHSDYKYYSTAIIYIPLLVVIPYCIYWMVKKIKICCDYHKPRRAVNNLDEDILVDENLQSSYVLSIDDNDVEYADRVMNPDLYNEQHVGVLPLPSHQE